MKNRRAIAFFLACSAVFALALALAWTYRHPVATVARATLSDLNVEEISSVEIERTVANGKSEQIAADRVRPRRRPLAVGEADSGRCGRGNGEAGRQCRCVCGGWRYPDPS